MGILGEGCLLLMMDWGRVYGFAIGGIWIVCHSLGIFSGGLFTSWGGCDVICGARRKECGKEFL